MLFLLFMFIFLFFLCFFNLFLLLQLSGWHWASACALKAAPQTYLLKFWVIADCQSSLRAVVCWNCAVFSFFAGVSVFAFAKLTVLYYQLHKLSICPESFVVCCCHLIWSYLGSVECCPLSLQGLSQYTGQLMSRVKQPNLALYAGDLS